MIESSLRVSAIIITDLVTQHRSENERFRSAINHQMKIRKLDFQEKEEEGERTSDDVIRADRDPCVSARELYRVNRREMKGFGGGGGK